MTRIEPEAGRQIERESEVRYWVAAAKPIVIGTRRERPDTRRGRMASTDSSVAAESWR